MQGLRARRHALRRLEPVGLALPGVGRQFDEASVPLVCLPVRRHTVFVKAGEDSRQLRGSIALALQGAEHPRRFPGAHRQLLDRLRQNRVRPQFDEQACAVLEQSLDSTIEAHHSAGIAHPVGGVGAFALQVSGAAGNPWNFRGIRLDVGETGLDVGKARLHLPRMERIGCRHQEGEPAGFSQALFQGGHGARLTGYHAGDVAVDHRDFQRRAKHGLQLFGGSPDHHHAAAAEGTLHGVGAVIDDLYRRAQVQGAGAPGRRHLAHRMPNHRAWRDTPAAQAFGEGDLMAKIAGWAISVRCRRDSPPA